MFVRDSCTGTDSSEHPGGAAEGEAGLFTSHRRHRPSVQMMLGLCKTECGLDQGGLAWDSEISEQHVEG